MLFFKWTVIHSGLFFPLAFLFLITLQDSFTEKTKRCDIHYILSLIHQRWQISPCLNIRNCSLVCAQMGHCCILGQRGGGVRNYGEENTFPWTAIAYKKQQQCFHVLQTIGTIMKYHCKCHVPWLFCNYTMFFLAYFLPSPKARDFSVYKGVISLGITNAL